MAPPPPAVRDQPAGAAAPPQQTSSAWSAHVAAAAAAVPAVAGTTAEAETTAVHPLDRELRPRAAPSVAQVSAPTFAQERAQAFRAELASMLTERGCAPKNSIIPNPPAVVTSARARRVASGHARSDHCSRRTTLTLAQSGLSRRAISALPHSERCSPRSASSRSPRRVEVAPRLAEIARRSCQRHAHAFPVHSAPSCPETSSSSLLNPTTCACPPPASGRWPRMARTASRPGEEDAVGGESDEEDEVAEGEDSSLPVN